MQFNYREAQGGYLVELSYEKQKDSTEVPDNLTENQYTILSLLLTDTKLSMSELAFKLNISKRKILDNMNKLKELGFLQRIGNNKTGYWKVVESYKNTCQNKH